MNPPNASPIKQQTDKSKSPLVAVISIILMLAIAILIALTAMRVYQNYSQPDNEFNWSKRGHSDFHIGVYYPSVAFRNQINPYSVSVTERYPVSAPSRACPPITFMLHLPFSFLDQKTADIAYFALNVAMLFGLAFLAIQFSRGGSNADGFPWLVWLIVSTVLLISRPGHITLFTGYYTLELVLGTIVALQFANHRPWTSATGILIASAKPTYVLPLIILMIARKNYQAAWRGVLLCVVFGLVGLGWLAQQDGISSVVRGIQEGQAEFHGDPTEFPINTWTRVDIVGMFAKPINWIPDDKAYLAGMLLLLIAPCILINQITDRETNRGVTGLTGCIALLSMLIGIYHHSYDCLLIAVPWVGLMFFGDRILPETNRNTRWLLGILLLVPLLNYLSTKTARDKLGFDQTDVGWQLITMINGICLLVALLILMAIAYRQAVRFTILRDFGK